LEARVFSHQERVNNDCRLFHTRRLVVDVRVDASPLALAARAFETNAASPRATRGLGWNTKPSLFFCRVCVLEIVENDTTLRVFFTKNGMSHETLAPRTTRSTRDGDGDGDDDVARHTPTPTRREWIFHVPLPRRARTFERARGRTNRITKRDARRDGDDDGDDDDDDRGGGCANGESLRRAWCARGKTPHARSRH